MKPEYIYKKVGSIIFGVLSPQTIKKMATVKVVTPELYDKEGYPVDGGLMDTRMGVIDPGLKCPIDGKKLKECPGYFGYIELARPVVHINHVKPILDFLRVTCNECGKVLLTEKDRERWIAKQERVEKEKGLEQKRKVVNDMVNAFKSVKKCPHCDAKQYTVSIDKPTSYVENDRRLNPIEVRARLERISNEDVKLMGLNPEMARPEWFVITLMPIPPVTIRPSITLETGERSEDDLTHKLSDIVRINQRLFENINAGAPEVIIEDLWDLLQYHITTFFNNSLASVPPARHRSGDPLKTLADRIKSKEGRFRHNLAGKRVNFSARSVITPDPQIKLDEVGVPLHVALELTVPEMVNEWNIERLKEFIKRGPENYPGANYVVRPDGKKKKITEETKEQLIDELTEGFIVERHLMDGDVAIFNRQPSLHRMSIMCHKVKVFNGKSFRINPSVCRPYNADFDGDEMNLHIPQTQEAIAEADILMEVRTQIISPKNGMNIIASIQDSITGNYLLTKSLILTREEAVELLLSINCENFKGLRGKEVDGKQVFSCLLPDDFDFIGDTREGKEPVKIENGNLISGVIDQSMIGDSGGQLTRSLYVKYGDERTLDLMWQMSQLGIKVLARYGFTTGIEDTDLSDKLKQEIDKLVNDGKIKVEELIVQYKEGKLDAFPGKTIEETLELKIIELLSKVRNKIGSIVTENSNVENPSIIMATSGARGNTLNLTQNAAMVGQQSLVGQRINTGYYGRTLPYFKKGDLGSDAHGFIKSSYRDGLNPYEFFFHAMTGRDSLMDTALRTPKSGYLYRRLSSALQDLKVEYDGTVRSGDNSIIQFKYGDDMIDVSKSDGGTINIKKIIREVLK